ncbi:hypothetical protein EJ02DRAFT_51215 [Clathrospora elynae]|uniref:Uncharacterized protein n=1 Tax=Clathrospora elynae TaxID=706981 RepID=A0A6A5SZ35_9PLEO|nr:hypothetical protein EJ02DRAFT_51215 [Clathrospora elynae]
MTTQRAKITDGSVMKYSLLSKISRSLESTESRGARRSCCHHACSLGSLDPLRAQRAGAYAALSAIADLTEQRDRTEQGIRCSHIYRLLISSYSSSCSTHQVKETLLFYLPHLPDTRCREPLLLSKHQLLILIPLIPENQPCIPPTTYHTSSLLALVVPSSRTDPHNCLLCLSGRGMLCCIRGQS